MKTDEMITLLEYSRWANLRIFRRSARLSLKQLTAPDMLTHGSLLSTLIHIIDTEWSWRSCCELGTMPVDYLTDTQLPDLPAIRSFSQAESDSWVAYIHSLTEEKASGEIEYSWPRARPRRVPLWQVVMHVVNHGTQHRSEVGAYLTSCGHSPGNIDLIIFTSKHKAEASS